MQQTLLTWSKRPFSYLVALIKKLLFVKKKQTKKETWAQCSFCITHLYMSTCAPLLASNNKIPAQQPCVYSVRQTEGWGGNTSCSSGVWWFLNKIHSLTYNTDGLSARIKKYHKRLGDKGGEFLCDLSCSFSTLRWKQIPLLFPPQFLKPDETDRLLSVLCTLPAPSTPPPPSPFFLLSSTRVFLPLLQLMATAKPAETESEGVEVARRGSNFCCVCWIQCEGEMRSRAARQR